MSPLSRRLIEDMQIRATDDSVSASRESASMSLPAHR